MDLIGGMSSSFSLRTVNTKRVGGEGGGGGPAQRLHYCEKTLNIPTRDVHPGTGLSHIMGGGCFYSIEVSHRGKVFPTWQTDVLPVHKEVRPGERRNT